MPLPTVVRRRSVHLAVIVLLVLLAGGCGGKTAKSAAEQSAAPQASTPTAAPTTTRPPPMTAAELAWLEALPKLDAKIDKAIQGSTLITPAVLRSMASAFRSCTLGLQRLGLPSERLRPVYELVKRGCGEFDKGAKCFATAASLGTPLDGTPQRRALDKAMDCGFKSQPKAVTLLVRGFNKGEEMKSTFGTS
jgi:hypothetical protein